MRGIGADSDPRAAGIESQQAQVSATAFDLSARADGTLPVVREHLMNARSRGTSADAVRSAVRPAADTLQPPAPRRGGEGSRVARTPTRGYGDGADLIERIASAVSACSRSGDRTLVALADGY